MGSKGHHLVILFSAALPKNGRYIMAILLGNWEDWRKIYPKASDTLILQKLITCIVSVSSYSFALSTDINKGPVMLGT